MRHHYLLSDNYYQDEFAQKVLPFINRYQEQLSVTTMDNHQLNATVYALKHSDKVVCIAHGYCEFALKYAEIIYIFLKCGYSVAIVEHRGHGYSYRPLSNMSKVHIDSYKTYVQDYHCFMNAVRGRFGQKKYYLFAHSMGGCVGTLYMEQYPEAFKAAILSAPMFDIDANGLPKDLCIAYGKVKTARHQGELYLGNQDKDFDGKATFENSNATSFQRWNTYYQLRLNDVHYQSCQGTIEWLTASLEAEKAVHRDVAKLKTPFLMFQAGNDKMVPPEGQDLFLKKTAYGAKYYIANAKHELFNSTYGVRKEYWQAVLRFLESFD